MSSIAWRQCAFVTSVSASRQLLSLGICCVALMLIVGCNSKEQQTIDPRDLENIKLGEVVHLSGMLKKPAEAVCALTDYEARLDEKESLSRQVNAYLTATKFTLDEGHWALVFVNGDKIDVQTFRRSKLAFVARHEGVPRNFRPVDCTSVPRALVTKVKYIFAPALILGEER